jgi:hypothetical protein
LLCFASASAATPSVLSTAITCDDMRMRMRCGHCCVMAGSVSWLAVCASNKRTVHGMCLCRLEHQPTAGCRSSHMCFVPMSLRWLLIGVPTPCWVEHVK